MNYEPLLRHLRLNLDIHNVLYVNLNATSQCRNLVTAETTSHCTDMQLGVAKETRYCREFSSKEFTAELWQQIRRLCCFCCPAFHLLNSCHKYSYAFNSGINLKLHKNSLKYCDASPRIDYTAVKILTKKAVHVKRIYSTAREWYRWPMIYFP